jgi:hypothetical protein
LYEGQFIMATSTTQSIWRSGGGDQTRTAYAGSMDMVAQFYIANTSSTTANVVVSSTNSSPIILPANAVVLTVNICNPSTGANSTCNIGYTPLISVGPGQTTTLGTNVPNAFVNNANVTTRAAINIGTASTGGSSLGNVANATNLIVVTSAIGTAGAVGGPVTGSIRYYVADNGQQSA